MNNDCAISCSPPTEEELDPLDPGPATSIHPPNEQNPRSREPGGLLSHHPIYTGVGGFVRLPGPANFLPGLRTRFSKQCEVLARA
jgi:hypothetical protein